MKMKTVAFCLVFIASVTARDFNDLESNLIEYDVPIPLRRMSRPYSYQDNRENRVVVEPAYYNAYDTGVLPVAPAEVQLSKLGLIATIVSYTISLAKVAFVFLYTNWSALSLGSTIALGLCKFTPICSKWSGIHTLREVQTEFRSFATPERIARAADFVQKAIKKYSSMQ